MELYDGEQFYYKLNGQIEGSKIFSVFGQCDYINGRIHKYRTCYWNDYKQIFYRINGEPVYFYIEYQENNSCITLIENHKMACHLITDGNTLNGDNISNNINIFDYIPEEYKYLLKKYKWIIDLNKDTIDKITEELKN